MNSWLKTPLLNNKTAILIFANSGQQEAFAKQFKSSQLLFDELNCQTLKKVKATGLPYFHISENEQIGATFAERFTNAIQSIYDKGFDSVISIGNDTPHLKSGQIIQAAKELKNHDIVLGPSLDGGFYLMGLKKSHFSAETFLKLPWQTSRLSHSFYRLIEANNTRVFKLEALSDIDTVSDIKFILGSKKYIASCLKIALLEVILEANQIDYSFQFHFTTSFQNSYFNKGSPHFIYA
ncbi:hypothetical protein LX77_02300 [Gelidibacter algens]|uniref:DUF2064 domain-containing protein n=1 Tax=Gelidibacter algens TaxID=49280 RepID=A0A327S212_9FLAO|nr:hypothetical protein LX77_02300 [Gelidibacter algens]